MDVVAVAVARWLTKTTSASRPAQPITSQSAQAVGVGLSILATQVVLEARVVLIPMSLPMEVRANPHGAAAATQTQPLAVRFQMVRAVRVVRAITVAAEQAATLAQVDMGTTLQMQATVLAVAVVALGLITAMVETAVAVLVCLGKAQTALLQRQTPWQLLLAVEAKTRHRMQLATTVAVMARRLAAAAGIVQVVPQT